MSAWIVSPRHVTVLVNGAIRHGVIAESDAEATGIMLTRANVRSIRARYGERDDWAKAVKPYRYTGPLDGYSGHDAVLLKQVACYGYQTCEYDGYPESPAGRFVERMEAALEKLGVSRRSPGYEDAPWGI